MNEKIREYPCVKIDGTIHITISGSECECGKSYSYDPIPEPKDTLIVSSPLLWRTLPEVTCIKCRRSIENKLHERAHALK